MYTTTNLGILLSFKLVEQLSAQHNVEVLFNALSDFHYCIPALSSDYDILPPSNLQTVVIRGLLIKAHLVKYQPSYSSSSFLACKSKIA